MPKTITFDYLNHNGKKALRTVNVESIEFVSTVNFGYQPGWVISGYCHDKKARRSFYLTRIIFPDGTAPKLFTLLRL